ncbi:MAG: DNA primase [Bryobacteraceae bacterium]
MDFVEHLRSSIDIVQVIGERVRLRRASAGRYTGLCPFHQEKTPSFSVNSTVQRYYCFGCHASGDLFQFVMEYENLTFPEALKHLADGHGIPMPARKEHSDPAARQRSAIYEMHEFAAKVFQANLQGPAGADARSYLARRGVAPELAEQFVIGFSERSGQALFRKLQQQGFSSDHIEASGLVNRREDGSFYDRFRGRLMFPICNEQGTPIAFGGRALSDEDQPKYMNSPETPIYRKSYVLYNLHRAKQSIRKHECAVLVEGYMDVIGVHGAGIGEVVASCGTALTAAQVQAIHRNSDRIVVNFDPDAAGVKAAEKSIEMLLEEGMHVRMLELDGGLDPDEYVKKFGPDAYRAKLQKAPGYFSWLAERARKRFDMRTAEGRMEGLKFLLPSIQRIGDRLERAAVANEVADYLGIERGLVLDEFRKIATNRRNGQPKAGERERSLPPSERVLVRSLVSSHAVRQRLLPRLQSCAVLERFRCRPILDVMFALYAGEPEFSFADLEGRLEQNEKYLLAAAVFADNSDEVFTLEQAAAYLGVLETDEKHAQVSSLRVRLKEAERGGDMAEAFRLMQQMDEVQKG